MVGLVQSEKRLLWHPRQENKFVVGGGNQITLYEWDQQEIRHITSQHDLQFMKTFAWSPDPAFEDLVAVGLSTGRIDLLRLEATRHTRRTSAGNSILSSGPIVSLTARNSRACNALDFCRVDPNFIAVGLDKVRGDSSLVIYDITSARSSLVLELADGLDAAEVVPLPRPGPHVPRFDINARADQRTVQHHAPTEVVSSVAYVSNSNHLLLAGMSYRWFRLLDIRTPIPAVTSFAAKVQSIVTDPHDAHRLATFGDGAISIWDARKLGAGPMLSFTEKDAAADGAQMRTSAMYAGIEFSSTRRGTLAALHRESSYVRFWDVMSTQATRVNELGENSSDGEAGENSSLSSRLTRKSWTAGLPWAGGGSAPSLPSQTVAFNFSKDPDIILGDTRRTKSFPKVLSSFALVPSPSQSSRLPLASNVMVVNKDGDLELYALHDTPKQAIWSSRGDLAISAGQSCRVFPGILADEEQQMIQQQQQEERERESSLEQMRYAQQQATVQTERSRSTMESKSGERAYIMERGRMPLPSFESPPPLFGRGDEDGFPALGAPGTGVVPSPAREASRSSAIRTTAPTGISSTRPSSLTNSRSSLSKSRTFSPASMRRYPYDTSTQRSQSLTDASKEIINPSIPAAVPPTPTDAAVKSRGRSKKQTRLPHGRSLSKVRGFEHVVEEDISMIMRHRCLQGYSVGNPYHNPAVTRDDEGPVPHMLSDLWLWINNAQDFLCVPTPRLHGYDFSHQGIMGIWEGFPPVVAPGDSQALPEAGAVAPTHRDLLGIRDGRSRSRSRRSHSPADDLHGNFHAALTALTLRSGDRTSTWKFHSVTSNKFLQRQVALQLCGWSLKEEDLWNNIKRWEKEGNHSRAACWLVFTQQYTKAIEVLMRSNDESHHMMSGTLAALIPTPGGSNKSSEFREHCEHLIIRLQDPYFRAMLTQLILGDWSEVLDEETLPFSERLAIAFQFLDDKTLTSYLHRCVENSTKHGHIDGLLVTGLTKRGMDILQGHVNRSGDVQTAAILSSYTCPLRFTDPRAERWVEAYRDLLDGFKLHHHRVSFDIERGGIWQDAVQYGDRNPIEWAPAQILIRCNYCNKPVSNNSAGSAPKHRPTTCANCSRALPRCSVCLMTLSIVPDAARDVELTYSPDKDTIDDAIVICQTCRHGGHASHILDWFFGDDGVRSHGLCAVANCDCSCADEI
ncbi:zinc-ribbon-16 domain-containing protein [Favolaschia claudopus]|uniref:Zinc-ribbon-16 domain-containing protein n=1 Tax=Favolaschia claudopus TaxID=2862362 RepID=A0AAW0EAN7_9AGAR